MHGSFVSNQLFPSIFYSIFLKNGGYLFTSSIVLLLRY